MIKSKRLLSIVLTGMIFLTTGCFFNNGGNTGNSGKDNNTTHAQVANSENGSNSDNQNGSNNENGNSDENGNPDVNNPDNPDTSGKDNSSNESEYILPPMENYYHAMYGDKVYFRIYDRDDFIDPVYPYFGQYYRIDDYKGNTRTIKVMNFVDGSFEDDITGDPGSGPLYVADGKLFTQQYYNSNGIDEYQLYYYDLENNSDKAMLLDDYGSTIGSSGKYIFAYEKILNTEYHYYEHYPCIIDATSLQKVANFPGTYIGADDEGVYSYVFEYEELTDNENSKFFVYKTDYDGLTYSLAEFDKDDFEDWIFDWGGPEITCFQSLENEIIFNFGFYAGTGHFYNGGYVYLVGKDGSNGRKICDNSSSGEFCAIEDGDSLNVFTYGWNSHDETTSAQWYNVRGEEKILASYHGQEFCKPYTYYSETMMPDYGQGNETLYGGETVIYYGGEEEYYKLISLEDFEDFDFKYGYEDIDDYDNSNLTEIYNVEYAGDMLFFTVGVLERNPNGDAGWRYAYDHGRTMDLVKNLKTGKVIVLAEY